MLFALSLFHCSCTFIEQLKMNCLADSKSWTQFKIELTGSLIEVSAFSILKCLAALYAERISLNEMLGSISLIEVLIMFAIPSWSCITLHTLSLSPSLSLCLCLTLSFPFFCLWTWNIKLHVTTNVLLINFNNSTLNNKSKWLFWIESEASKNQAKSKLNTHYMYWYSLQVCPSSLRQAGWWELDPEKSFKPHFQFSRLDYLSPA